jgi:hypothetical protein
MAVILVPVRDAIEKSSIRGRDRALAVLRAGLVLVKFGTWLLAREGAENLEQLVEAEETQARVDSEALAEMVISNDVGSPYPIIDG